MKVIQTSSMKMWLSEEDSVDARVTVELRVPDDEFGPSSDASVSILLPWAMFEHHFTEGYLLTVDTRFRDAVHGGIGYYAGRLPLGGIGVKITDLSVEPSDLVNNIADETRRTELIAGVIEILIYGTVASLCNAIRQLGVEM